MRDLNYQLKQLCQHNRDGSYSTRATREWILSRIANELRALGYRRMHSRSLKPKHVEALSAHWLALELGPGTIKNRMSAIRWWAEKIGKPNVVARRNAFYGIPDRSFLADKAKATNVTEADLSKVNDAHVRMSLRLQAAFGLRREEAIKFIPAYADRGHEIHLKATWTKGGKARVVPICNPRQREVLDEAHALAGKGSLIPSSKNYVAQLRVYERHTANAGLSKLHGLRHAYAQTRYAELTGWASTVAGGVSKRELSVEQQRVDQVARLQISRELGHEREAITRTYLD